MDKRDRYLDQLAKWKAEPDRMHSRAEIAAAAKALGLPEPYERGALSDRAELTQLFHHEIVRLTRGKFISSGA